MTETAGESSVDTSIHRPDTMRPSTSTGQDSKVRELSGRSRAILKQYFDEDATTINFPLGHRTVAFTEPQVYHLLRVLTDETLKMSFTAMEQMVIGAVRGAPVTSSSRTDHFRVRPRAQTPGHGLHSDSEDSSHSENFPGSGTDTSAGSSSGQEDRGLDSSNDTDSSGEMALISQASKEPFRPASTPRKATEDDPSQAGFESTEQSSLDATLTELRTQTSPAPTLASSSGKAPKRKRRKQTRGVPMREEFFSKIGWTTLVTPDSRAKTQIHLIRYFVQQLGDIGVLRKLWSQIGSLTNYQISYGDFDWGEERISVSSLLSLRTA